MSVPCPLLGTAGTLKTEHVRDYQAGGLNLNAGHFAQLSGSCTLSNKNIYANFFSVFV